MADEIALTKSVSDAKRAELLMGDDLLQGAFRQLEHDYIAKWRITEARDTDARERLWLAVQVIGKVRQHLQTAMANGKLAQHELDALAARKKRGIFSVV